MWYKIIEKTEYEAIKKDTVKTDQPTPQELLNYLNKEF